MRIPLLAATAALIMLSSLPEGRCAENQTLTNPLLKVMRFKEIRPFKYKIELYIEQKKADGSITECAFYFRSLADGIWTGINEKMIFSAASLLKVPVLIAYYKLAETDPDILNRKLKYEILMDEMRDFLPKYAPVAGNYYTVDELISIMIRQSDNNALLILSKNIEDKYLLKIKSDVGIAPYSDTNLTGDGVTIKNIVSLFRVLYNASYLDTKMSEKALHCMTNTDFNRGIIAGIPARVTVSHKFAERNFVDTNIKELHECGIVYYKKNPYLIGVMTRGKDFDKLTQVIMGLSKIVYDEMDSQYSSTEPSGPFSE